jgi:hypothetical protein
MIAARFFVLAVLVVGCGVLWLGVPLGGLWLAGQFTASFGPHLVLALVFMVAGMVVMGAALSWVNDLYLRVTGGTVVISDDLPVRRRGPLEPMLVATLFLAAAAFAVWFVVLAENPTINVY